MDTSTLKALSALLYQHRAPRPGQRGAQTWVSKLYYATGATQPPEIKNTDVRTKYEIKQLQVRQGEIVYARRTELSGQHVKDAMLGAGARAMPTKEAWFQARPCRSMRLHLGLNQMNIS